MIFSNRLLATTSLITLIVVVAAASASLTNAIVVESSRESVRRRATTATKEDFTIKCQTDHIVWWKISYLPLSTGVVQLVPMVHSLIAYHYHAHHHFPEFAKLLHRQY